MTARPRKLPRHPDEVAGDSPPAPGKAPRPKGGKAKAKPVTKKLLSITARKAAEARRKKAREE